MASIELSPILEHLDEDLVQSLEAALADADASPLDVDEDAESVFLDSEIEDDMVAEIMDRLEVNDAAADVYVPPDFEEVFKIKDVRFASAHMLLLVLAEMREELFVDQEDEDEDEEPGNDHGYGPDEDARNLDVDDEEPFEFKEKQLQHVWRLLQTGAQTCVRRGVCMFIHG